MKMLAVFRRALCLVAKTLENSSANANVMLQNHVHISYSNLRGHTLVVEQTMG